MSINDILKQSGFLDSRGPLTVEGVQRCLQEDTTLVDEWLQWSQNKRTSAGWFIIKNLSGEGYSIGSLCRNEGVSVHDPLEATAVFIVRELSEMAERKRK